MGRPKRPSRQKPPGIREIAKTLGVSSGTVDRALHGRRGISAATRGQVLAAARSLDYRPNLAARFLKSRRQLLRIAVNLPREIASFYDFVRDGILEAARPFEPNGVSVVFRSYPRLGEGEREALEEGLRDGVQGFIIAPGLPEGLAPLIRRAAGRGIPVVCVSTDAPRTKRLAAVSVDPVTNGSLVGELMGRFLGGEGRVVVVTGQLGTVDHAGKLAGFRKTAREMWPRLEVAALVEAHDDAAEAYEKCRQVFERSRDLRGVYVSTANSLPVLRALEDGGLARRVTVIATDLFPALVPFVASGMVAATIHQRPWRQGQIAFQTLYRFLVEGVVHSPLVRLPPHVVMRSNLKLFLERRWSTSGSGRTGSFTGESSAEDRPRTIHEAGLDLPHE